jgi:hypothetical protein
MFRCRPTGRAAVAAIQLGQSPTPTVPAKNYGAPNIRRLPSRFREFIVLDAL